MNLDKFQKSKNQVLADTANMLHENGFFGGGTNAMVANQSAASASAPNGSNGNQHLHFNRHTARYTPYNKRTHANAGTQAQTDRTVSNVRTNSGQSSCENANNTNHNGKRSASAGSDTFVTASGAGGGRRATLPDIGSVSNNGCVILQISNLDTSIDERILKQHLINRLRPITTVLSIHFETMSVAKIKLPSQHHARQAIAHLHRKKIGHKRITVAQTRDSSSLEPSTLRCQVAGLLKDIPNYKLSMYKFRELFQSRFKTSISVNDLYDMKDICTIGEEKNEDKFIMLRPELITSIENSDLMDCLQHSVPYCSLHFVKTHRGWAEQEIDPLPNVQMTVHQVRCVLHELLKAHKGDIPIASIVHCIQSELKVQLLHDEQGVNFEHLISCVPGIQIGTNKFGIKILGWANVETGGKDGSNADESMVSRFGKYGDKVADPFSQVQREIIELIKMSPKSTLKFSRFIPAYHNHFGKQCRVADYGYTKLIDLFEALPNIVQVMGDGENRLVTLTHKSQVRRFTTDLLRILRSQTNKSIYLSQLSQCYANLHGKPFDVTDYGVCDVEDILTGMANSNIVVVSPVPQMMDLMISIPKRKQSNSELEKTSIFAGEVVELFKFAPQFVIPFEKFACAYHYQFGYQCRLCDYGFSKLADLMESISGLVETEFSNEEDRKVLLAPKTAQRIFSEQLKLLAAQMDSSNETQVSDLHKLLIAHKKEYGYQILPQSLGFNDWFDCIRALPFIEVITKDGMLLIKCQHDNEHFRQKCYAACRILLDISQQVLTMDSFIEVFSSKFNEMLSERAVESMNHAIEIIYINDTRCVTISKLMKFVIAIVNIIEPIGTMKIAELKSTLNLPINGCFSFGFPNLMSLLQAFPDVFILTGTKVNNSRGEIKLNKQCMLTGDGFNKYAYTPPNGIQNDLNGTLATSGYDSIISNAIDKNVSAASMGGVDGGGSGGGHSSSFGPNSVNEMLNQPSSTGEYYQFMEMMSSDLFFPSGNSSFNTSEKQGIDMSQLDGSIEQKFKNNTSYEFTEAIALSTSHGMPFNGTSEDIPTFGINNQNAYNVNDISKFDPNGMASSSDCNFGALDLSKNGLYNTYQPPKPDTPPHMPYWLDPVWTRRPFSSKPMLNINLPDFKVSQAVPKLDTPTVMAALGKSHCMAIDDKENTFFK